MTLVVDLTAASYLPPGIHFSASNTHFCPFRDEMSC